MLVNELIDLLLTGQHIYFFFLACLEHAVNWERHLCFSLVASISVSDEHVANLVDQLFRIFRPLNALSLHDASQLAPLIGLERA